MYHQSITYEVAQQKQRDWMAEAKRERTARQSRPAVAPSAPRSRTSRRTWHLVLPLRRPQAL
jgi:hypothetical protein